MSALPGAFHWRGEWYFRREEDGSVTIQAGEDFGVRIVRIPANEWASIVGHVAAGDDADSVRAAEALHAGTVAFMGIAPGERP